MVEIIFHNAVQIACSCPDDKADSIDHGSLPAVIRANEHREAPTEFEVERVVARSKDSEIFDLKVREMQGVPWRGDLIARFGRPASAPDVPALAGSYGAVVRPHTAIVRPISPARTPQKAGKW
jgi:hypothetical protein